MALYKNPYRPVDPDIEEWFDGRKWVITSLDNYILNVVEPLCVSVVAERGIGGKAAVRNYLQLRKAELSLRIVECDVKNFPKGGNAADFYRELVLVLLSQLSAVPPEIHKVASRLMNNKSGNLYEINDDFWLFFELVLEQDASKPLLLVFYSFDQLPKLFQFGGLDWTLLKQLHEKFTVPLYYLVVSRRLLKHIEELHGLVHSRFATLFQSLLRIGLLEIEEARRLIREPAQITLNCAPWPEWLEALILEWSGRNPHCIQIICFYLFSQLWIQGENISPDDIQQLNHKVSKELRLYFKRLLDNLIEDRLIDALIYTVESGYSTVYIDQTEQLIDLGYFLPELVQNNEYRLFSPLFQDYLVQRGILSAVVHLVEEGGSDSVVISPKVQAILNQTISQELRIWQKNYFKRRTRLQEKPDTDEYILCFLTGYEEGLEDTELQELRRCLFDAYFDESTRRNDRRSRDVKRTYFHKECERWLERYKEDETS